MLQSGTVVGTRLYEGVTFPATVQRTPTSADTKHAINNVIIFGEALTDVLKQSGPNKGEHKKKFITLLAWLFYFKLAEK